MTGQRETRHAGDRSGPQGRQVEPQSESIPGPTGEHDCTPHAQMMMTTARVPPLNPAPSRPMRATTHTTTAGNLFAPAGPRDRVPPSRDREQQERRGD